jgi:hypothetical protein
MKHLPVARGRGTAVYPHLYLGHPGSLSYQDSAAPALQGGVSTSPGLLGHRLGVGGVPPFWGQALQRGPLVWYTSRPCGLPAVLQAQRLYWRLPLRGTAWGNRS